ncbi:MAG: mechanosensitive ion channel family protein [Treponema sp.]|jgi:MscS family membrane protein|nr:mechanosensitive ion channel family protein [Treponema sp.]
MDEFLQVRIGGNQVQQWLCALAFMGGGFLAGKLCTRILSGVVKHIYRKTSSSLDDRMVETAKPPLTWLVTIGAIAYGLSVLDLHETPRLWLNRVVASLIIVVLARGVAALLDLLISRYVPVKAPGPLSKKETDMQPLLRKLSGILVWVIAGVLILRTLGYNVSALMAGLGLGGAALALASKDTLSNCFGSITVFVDRPFAINDRIKIAGYDGVITDMGLRTSRLRTLENCTVIIPNSIFASSPIENISAAPNRKVSQTLAVKTSSGLEKIEAALVLLREIGSTIEGTDGAPLAGLTMVSGSTCQITFTFHIAKDADYMATLNAVNLAVLQRFEEAGVVLG